MSRTVAEEEKQVQALVRRAEGSDDKSGAVRREALERLIALCSSEHASLKIYAADHIRLFFSDFPDLEEAAINAIYDVCEDQSGDVRKQGYHAITQLSRVHSKCIKRNADVLLQLLQSDEQDEVAVVKKALIEHLDLNPQITLGVLCDQISADSTDDDDASLRDKLRSLVIAFIGTAKATIRRHAAKSKELENSIADRLIASFTKMAPSELVTIVQGLLLSLPSFQSASPSKGQALLQGLIEKAKTALSSNDWDTVRTCLDLAATVVDKRVTPPTDLLRFYYQTFAPKRVLEKLDAEKAALVLWRLSQTLVACDNLPESNDIRKKVIDASSIFFERLQVLSHSDTVREQTIDASKLVLQSCLHRNSEGWQVPQHIQSAATALGQSLAKSSYGEHSKDVHDLIRSLVPNYKPQVQVQGQHPKKEMQMQIQIPIPMSGGSTKKPSPTPARDTSSRRIMKLPSRGTKHLLDEQDDLLPNLAKKRIKLGGGDSPSLLVRLGTASPAPRASASASSSPSAAAGNFNSPVVVATPQPVTQTQGFSIKGAATKAKGKGKAGSSRTSEESDVEMEEGRKPPVPQRPRQRSRIQTPSSRSRSQSGSHTSLLSRLEGAEASGGKRRR